MSLDCNLDFNFPKYNPNPEDLKMLHEISQMLLKKIMLILVLDLMVMVIVVGVIDNNGMKYFADKIGLLIARNLSKNIKIQNLLLM